MGTTFELVVRDDQAPFDENAIDTAFAWLREVDERFSTYRPESEVARIRAGILDPVEASPDVQYVLGECEAMRRRTDGFFDIHPGGSGSPLDTSGYVKGWAMERAAAIVAVAGARSFAFNGGGDVIARGRPSPGATWRVGIRHPVERDRVAAVIGVTDLAIATSGAYERGEHIRDPHTGRPPAGVLSVTVVGPSLTIADVFATAAFAMGDQGIRWLSDQPDYEGCVITADGRLRATTRFEALRIRD